MSCPVDVLVVGAGPAGGAAAITAAAAGLRVRVVERACFPRHRPGETLHPGVEPILERLGVAETVTAASAIRHEAQAVHWGGRSTVTPFGADERGPWRGFQVERQALDRILLKRACEVGADVRQPEAVGAPVVEHGRVGGGGHHRAKIVIDASGGAGWLRRRLNLPVVAASPKLHAWYGYCGGDCDAVPSLIGDGLGWTWTAQVARGRVHWTRLAFPGAPRPLGPPPHLAALPELGRQRCADVTWRHVPASAGPGWFLAGDAAAVLDPAASHGVLRALMTGIAAAEAAASLLSGEVGERDTVEQYQRWVAAWFTHDRNRLKELYQQLDPREGIQWPTR